jgi:hypothetical protein
VQAPITLSFDFDERKAIARFTALPADLQKALVARLRPVEQAMLSRVQAVVPRATGKLFSEIRGFLDTGPDWVRARVRVVVDRDAGSSPRGNYDAGKAASLEYGAKNSVQVRAFRRKRGEDVRSYQRRVNITAQQFLRGSFSATRSEAEAAIRAAIADVAKNGGFV